MEGVRAQLPLTQMFRQRHHIAILLLSLGLALLGIFLWLFLKKTWDDEHANLRRETNLLFINAVHGIESQMFDRLIVKRWEGAEGDTSVNISLRFPPPLHRPDSAKAFVFVQERSLVTSDLLNKTDSSHTKMKIIFDTERSPGEAEMSGSLSMFMSADSNQIANADSANFQFLKALERNFYQAMERAVLPVEWKVTRLETPKDSSPQQGTFMAGQYTDMLSGERFGAEISQYQGYLLRKTGPQILFSMLQH